MKKIIKQSRKTKLIMCGVLLATMFAVSIIMLTINIAYASAFDSNYLDKISINLSTDEILIESIGEFRSELSQLQAEIF